MPEFPVDAALVVEGAVLEGERPVEELLDKVVLLRLPRLLLREIVEGLRELVLQDVHVVEDDLQVVELLEELVEADALDVLGELLVDLLVEVGGRLLGLLPGALLDDLPVAVVADDGDEEGVQEEGREPPEDGADALPPFARPEKQALPAGKELP